MATISARDARKWKVQARKDCDAVGMSGENFQHYLSNLGQPWAHIKAQVIRDELDRQRRFKDKDAQPITLEVWTRKQSWTPEEGFYLVSGLEPKTAFASKLEAYTKTKYFGLCGNVFSTAPAALANVRREWAERLDKPERIAPHEFMAWCNEREINTEWLRDVSPGASEHVVTVTKNAGLTTTVSQSRQQHSNDAEAKAQRQAKRGYFLDEAAQVIADQQGESETWATALWQSMEKSAALPADHKFHLTVRDSHTGLVDTSGTKRRRSVVVKPSDVDKWLKAQGLDYLWQSEPPEPQVVPVVTASASSGAEPAKAGPVPLTTGDIAFCFAGLHWNTEREWKKPLGDKPKWLAACIVIPGVRGVSERRWSPVCIGAALVRAGHAKPNSVRAKFQTEPLLTPWLDEWKTYEADNSDSN